MATTKDYRDFILGQLDLLGDLTCRNMMGEYLLYYQKVLFGGIYDNRLLIKVVPENEKYHMSLQLPYKGAKMMYMIEDIDNKELLKEIILSTIDGLINEK